MSFISILIMCVYIFYSSYIGVKLSSQFCWDNVKSLGFLPLSIAVGLGCAPFILGLSTISSLYFFSGNSAFFHLIFVMFVLISFHLILMIFSKKKIDKLNLFSLTFEEYFFGFILITWVFLLFFCSFYYDLFENDALEYMIVAKQIFATNSLKSYPMINQENTASGFYGPWTHPPLYVSLLYLMDSIQGFAFPPGLARLISCWGGFLVTLIIYSLGGIFNRVTAVLSALICISTPLFFHGASTSSIDSLPMLGITLVFALLVGLEPKNIYKWVLIGLFLGMSLWTHSQAILFAPITMLVIFFLFGVYQFKRALIANTIVFVFASIIAIWPYINNYNIYGSLISDNNIVFSLPWLHWDEYFKYARGFDNVFSIIQYGIFKGWFCFESYGITFWLMTFGLIVLFKRNYSPIKSQIFYGIDNFKKADLVSILSTLFISIYFFLTIVSVSFGITLMIRNERYLLVMLPFVSIIGGFGTNYLIDKYKEKLLIIRYSKFFFIVGFYLISFLQFFIFYKIWYQNNKINTGICLNSSCDKKKNENIKHPIDMILNFNKDHKKNCLTLSFRPADMYYYHCKMISYLDPRLITFYKEKSPEKGLKFLQKLGIKYIYYPNYSFPVGYNSVLLKILGDPRLSKIKSYYKGYSFYQLGSEEGDFKLLKDLTPGKSVWTYYKKIRYVDEKTMNSFVHINYLNEKKLLDFRQNIAINNRNYSHVFYSSKINQLGHFYEHWEKIEPHKQYRIDIDLQGAGLVRLYMVDLNGKDQSTQLEERIIPKNNKISISKRFIATNHRVMFKLEIFGNSQIFIKSAKLYELT